MKAYRVYLVMEGAGALIFSMIFAASSLYQVNQAHLTALQLVLVGTILEASIFLFEVPTGVVADVYSRRASVIIGYFLIGAGFILEGSIAWFWTILLAQVLWGLGYTFTSGAAQAWITDEIGEAGAGKAFLRASQVGSLASLAGVVLGTVLANIRLNLAIQLGGVLLMGMGVFLRVVMPEHGFQPKSKAERGGWDAMWCTFQGGLSMVHRRPALGTILWIGFIYGLYSEGFDRLWVKHMLEGYALPAWWGMTAVTWNGVVRMGGMLVSVAAAEVVRRKLDTTRHAVMVRALVAFTILLIGGLGLFALGRSLVGMLASLWLISLARSVIGPLYTTWVNQRLDSSVRATVLSMSSQVDAMGQIVGGPAVGMIGSTLSVRAALSASAVLLTPVLGLLRRAERYKDEPVTPAG
jgi:DHA3 family tetracycline resistance protein-like MFS transporter